MAVRKMVVSIILGVWVSLHKVSTGVSSKRGETIGTPTDPLVPNIRPVLIMNKNLIFIGLNDCAFIPIAHSANLIHPRKREALVKDKYNVLKRSVERRRDRDYLLFTIDHIAFFKVTESARSPLSLSSF